MSFAGARYGGILRRKWIQVTRGYADDEMGKTNADGGDEEYTPAVVTAGEDRDVELAFRDERIYETEHVSMPDKDDQE